MVLFKLNLVELNELKLSGLIHVGHIGYVSQINIEQKITD